MAANSATLHGRDLEWARNTPELIAEHKRITGGKIRTRFPPEPNGYLHIGHAKSINMNFEGAFEKLNVPKDQRFVYFRYDDTNPEAESQEYIDALAENVRWLGNTPDAVTYSSDYFQTLYDLGIKLIKKGKAYICHQSKAEIEECRVVARARIKAIQDGQDPNSVPGKLYSPYRERPVEENLKLFEEMRLGLWEEGKICLRMKMDMESPNPNMWDSVAFRIKYAPHPHVGSKWCVYPTYDYTHCIVDSLEHIDYSICTLEFETRRESYYWLLAELDLYRPMVYEFARLVMTYTMMSKRKILKLVNSKFVRGWDDPRLCTLSGMRRRGYSADIINTLCKEIGVTRVRSVIQVEKLQSIARKLLGEQCTRAMAVLDPLPVVITNLDAEETRDVSDNPQNADCKTTHPLTLTKTIYIDRADFQLEPKDNFFGLGPNREVLLKYMYNFTCTEVVKDKDGNVKEIRGTVDKEMKNKCKPITWVGSKSTQKVEVRVYDHLFTVANLDDPQYKDKSWEEFLNRDSEKVYPSAMVDGHVAGAAVETSFQFERLGYFVVDSDSKDGKMVFNSIVGLVDKKDPEANKGSSRKEEQAKQLAAKEALKNLEPQKMFLGMTDLYSKFDDDGIPTHDASGAPLSKSKIKNLKKDWAKQKKLYERSK